jgi:hypothetical protein
MYGRKRRGKNIDLSEAGISPQKWYYLKLLEEKKYENWRDKNSSTRIIVGTFHQMQQCIVRHNLEPRDLNSAIFKTTEYLDDRV